MQNNHIEKILYITNTIAEYRVCFFEKLSEESDITFLITHPHMAAQIYGTDGSTNKLKVINLYGKLIGNIRAIRKEITSNKYSKIIIPPADSVKEIIEGIVSVNSAKKINASIYTWTEKWEPTKEFIPLCKKFKNMIQRIAYRYYVKNATRSIVFGEKSKEYIQMVGANSNKIRIAHMTSIPPRENNLFNVRKKYNIPDNYKIIFCLARMIPRKGLEVLLESMIRVSSKHKDCILLLGGDGPLKNTLKDMVKRYKLNCVIFLGRVNPEERSTYYSQADVFVLPSKIINGIIEGWGLPVNEALFCETPVIATTAVGSAYDMLINNCGIMVEQGKSAELAEAIEEILFKRNKEDIRYSIKKINSEYSLEEMTYSFLNSIFE